VPKSTNKQAVILLSGGIDSTTLLALLTDRGFKVTAITFDYGQTLKKEVQISQRNAAAYGAQFIVFNTPLQWTAPKCSLLGSDDKVPTGRSISEIEDSTPSTYVPFRNGIFLAYAVAWGEGHGVSLIGCGGNGLNSGNYYDDTAKFAKTFEKAAKVGTSPKFKPKIYFPWAKKKKSEIVKVGTKLGVNYDNTWSCYLNGETHCGKCDSCVQRQRALGHL